MIKPIIMRHVIVLSFVLFFVSASFSQQWRRAFMKEDMSIGAEKVKAPAVCPAAKAVINQLAGFPVAVPANPSFKNMRNVTLADMNADGTDDIIFAVDSKLYVYTFQGELWSKTIIGTAIYPPSVGDVDGDGFNDIVQVTGGSPANGRIYVFDRLGNVLTGWPANFNNNWIICAPALADLDGDNKMEIIVNERISPAGKLHVLKYDGTSYSANWPVTLDGIPAVTPSVADMDGDGQKEIIDYSTKSKYIFQLNGQPETGFPLTTAPGQSYSYQSPVIVDFDNDNNMEIVGATHGDLPQFYVMQNDNADYQSWPANVPDGSWTYNTPTVVKINGEWKIFMSRPINTDPLDMLYGWDKNGNMLSGFPIVKSGGLEGYISVADITGDADFELVFGSNLMDSLGFGFIHAYKMDGTGELNDFPLRPKGFTFMNGVCIGDVDGNGKTNLVALSYDLNFGSEPDSVYINVYDLNVNYDKSKVLWGTYKGSNTRTGYYGDVIADVPKNLFSSEKLNIYPNPVSNWLNISLTNTSEHSRIVITDVLGQIVYNEIVKISKADNQNVKINVSRLQKGFYNVAIDDDNFIRSSSTFVKF